MALVRFMMVHAWSPGIAAMISAMLLASAAPARAGEELLPEEALLRVHVAPLERLYENPLVQQIWERLQSSHSMNEALQTVEARGLQQAVTFLEQRLGRPWREIYASLTAGGIDIALLAEGRPALLIVAHAGSEQIVDDVVDLAVELAGSNVQSGEHRGITGYRIGDAAVAAVGRRLLIGSDAELLKATVDRILDDAAGAPAEVQDSSFQISATLDLVRLRAQENVARGLAVPAEDGGAMALLGGWIDLLRRHQQAHLNLRLASDAFEATVRLEGARTEAPPALAGYWADSPAEQPAPLLQWPGMIYSATWYRDYGALWEAREQLVKAGVVKTMEQADRDTAAQFEALGSAVSLSEVVQHFGPRYRVVVARQPTAPYEVKLRNPLPAAAVVIELRDEEAFRRIAAPLTRVLHLILSFEQKITSQPLAYDGAVLQQLSQPHTPDDVARRDLSAYNFRPTHTITRGHLIVGTTPQIVEQAIAALDALPGAASDLPPGVTAQQSVDIEQLASGLQRLRDAIVRQLVLSNGYDVETAGHELGVLLSILQLFDAEQITGVFTETGFEQRIRLTTR